jgi:hypothetical protein
LHAHIQVASGTVVSILRQHGTTVVKNARAALAHQLASDNCSFHGTLKSSKSPNHHIPLNHQQITIKFQ